MNGQVEHRSFDLELRAGRVIGTAMVYGDQAELGRGVSEVFQPGALKPTDRVQINVGHKAADIVAEAVEVRDDGQTLQVLFDATERVQDLVRDGYDRMSIEFRAVRESFDPQNFIRTISEAVLSGVALVKAPAYQQTAVEFRGQWKRAAAAGRRKAQPWARSALPIGKACDCECVSDEVPKVEFLPGAFQFLLDILRAGRADVTAIIGNRGPHNVLASTGSNMRLSLAGGAAIGGAAIGGADLDDPDDEDPEDRAQQLVIEIDATAANTPAGKSLIDADAIQPAVVRPLIDLDHEGTQWEDVDGVRRYSSVFFRTVLVKAAPERRGWRNIEWWQPDADDSKTADTPWWALL